MLKTKANNLRILAEKESRGEELTQKDKDLIDKNKAFYSSAKATIVSAEATNKASEFAGKEFKQYGAPKIQKDGSVEFVRQNKDGSVDTIVVATDGKVSKETTRADETVNAAKEEIEQENQNRVSKICRYWRGF